MRVLFVDDEPRVLQAIQRALFHLEDWEIGTAEGGAEALEALAEEAYDAIVTDMRMPGMDGAELLTLVKQHHPQVLRFILSGYSEQDAARRALPVAHRVLSKPIEAGAVHEALERARHLQLRLQAPGLAFYREQAPGLPAQPGLYAQLSAACALPNTGIKEAVALLGAEPKLGGEVLRLANTWLLRQLPAADLTGVGTRLGAEVLQGLATLAMCTEAFPLPDALPLTAAEGEAHAMQVAAVAGQLLPAHDDSNRALVAGMLHDVGQRVLASQTPQPRQQVLQKVAQEGLALQAAEAAICGTTHAELGAHVLDSWGVANPVVEAVAFHHGPESVPCARDLDVVAAVYIADQLTEGREPDRAYLERLGVAERLEQWRSVAERL